jgi:leucyl aminopeptidase
MAERLDNQRNHSTDMTSPTSVFLTHNATNSVPIAALRASEFEHFKASASQQMQSWLTANPHFNAAPDTALVIPKSDGSGIASVIAGYAGELHIWSFAALPALLPAGTYHFDAMFDEGAHSEIALGIALAQYQFSRYKKSEKQPFVLAVPANLDIPAISARISAISLTRDLINTPTNDMGPTELAEAARRIADAYGASLHEIVGDDLLAENYPAIHAVGRASSQLPRLLDLRYGDAAHPQIVLIGKGVCFDTGGLDIKPYAAMKLMKKDMGGAATVLGLAMLIMHEKLPVRLRVLIPAVENSIAGNAFRPQDIIATRKGLSVEIGSPDAEGRVILGDALTEAMSEMPHLVIDIATLTGAARTALGPELPALFSNHPEVAQELQRIAMQTHDPMWQLPLWVGYDKHVSSPIADITNSPNFSFAGAITAALYLQRFVEPTVPWIHIDSYAWNADAQPGRPAGGEALGLRALLQFLKQRYA